MSSSEGVSPKGKRPAQAGKMLSRPFIARSIRVIACSACCHKDWVTYERYVLADAVMTSAQVSRF